MFPEQKTKITKHFVLFIFIVNRTAEPKKTKTKFPHLVHEQNVLFCFFCYHESGTKTNNNNKYLLTKKQNKQNKVFCYFCFFVQKTGYFKEQNKFC